MGGEGEVDSLRNQMLASFPIAKGWELWGQVCGGPCFCCFVLLGWQESNDQHTLLLDSPFSPLQLPLWSRASIPAAVPSAAWGLRPKRTDACLCHLRRGPLPNCQNLDSLCVKGVFCVGVWWWWWFLYASHHWAFLFCFVLFCFAGSFIVCLFL